MELDNWRFPSKLYYGDCIEFMKGMEDGSVDFVLTDIPYDGVNRDSGGLRNMDKGDADVLTFDLLEFASEVYRISKNGAYIFCGHGQFSSLYNFFDSKEDCTVRLGVYEKTNPSPMNGQHVYLSGIELGVWFKKRGTTSFSGDCKNPVFRYPSGEIINGNITRKNPDLIGEILRDNTKKGELVFDPCAGSGTTLEVGSLMGRKTLGCELSYVNYLESFERLKRYVFIKPGKPLDESSVNAWSVVDGD